MSDPRGSSHDDRGSEPLSEADALFASFARTRDQLAFERLISGHLDSAYSQARYLLNSSADAEDAVQDALIQLVRTSHRYDGSIPFGAWFGRLVQLSALQLRRSRGRRAARERTLAPIIPEDPQEADPEILEQVRRAVADLPETLRLPMALHYFGGLSQQETARALNLTVDNLGMRLHRARAKLRVVLAKSGVSLSVAGISSAFSATAPLAAPTTLHVVVHGLIPSLAAPPAAPPLGVHWLVGHKAVSTTAAAAAAVALLVLAWVLTARPAVIAPLAPAPRIAPRLPVPLSRAAPAYFSYDLPDGASPGSIVAAADGSVWFQSILLTPRRASIFHLNVMGLPTLVLPPLASAPGEDARRVGYSDSLATDVAGNLWTLEPHAVVRRDAQGVVTRFPIDDQGAPVHSALDSIIIGPGGDPWFTDQGTSSIGRLDVHSGVITRFPTGLDYVPYDSLAYAPGGDIYALIDQNIYGMTPTGRPFLVTPTPAFPAVHLFHALVYGPDRALWFVDTQNDIIYRMTTAGGVSAFPVPTPRCGLSSIAVGREGTLVFTEKRGNRIGTIRADGMIIEYLLPVVGGPGTAAVADDGTIWIADDWARKILRLRR